MVSFGPTSPSASPTSPLSLLEEGEMPSPEAFYRDMYSHPRNGSAGSPSTPYSQTQYPSPADSYSGSGNRLNPDGEMAYAHDRLNQPSSSRSRNIPAIVRNGLETEPREGPPQFSVTVSPRNPRLHFLLSRDSAQANRFAVDMRREPRDSITRAVYDEYSCIWVNRDKSSHMRIVSHDFPWVIDIRGERGVTCSDIWNSLYQELAAPISDSDWSHLNDLAAMHVPDAQRRLEHLINIARYQRSRREDVLLTRLNWLMGKIVFLGLEKDENFRLSTRKLLPGTAPCRETWVAHFGDHDSE